MLQAITDLLHERSIGERKATATGEPRWRSWDHGLRS